jgi:hypothetical protein
MTNYEYPKQVTDDNFIGLLDRARIIRKRTYDLDVASIVVTFVVLGIPLAILIFTFRQSFQEIFRMDKTFILTTYLIIGGVFGFISTFTINYVRAFLRRLNFAIFNYPTSEECVFSESFIIANRLNKNRICGNWKTKYESATWRVQFLCDELSLFSKDFLNTKRHFYAKEFNLLANGESQISRFFLFSSSKASELLTIFALSFVRNEDVIAYRYLKAFFSEANKYGQFESLSMRLGNQLRSVRGIIALVGGVVALIGGILTIILQLT